MVGFAKEEFLRIQAAKDNKIRELENERRELQENAQRTEEEQRQQIQKLSDENEQLKKAAANQAAQNNKMRELENERRELQVNAQRTEQEQRRQIQKLSEENEQLKKAAANQADKNKQIRELADERRELQVNAQRTVEEQRHQIKKMAEEINQLTVAAENQSLLMEKNAKLFTEHRETLLQENEKLQNELSILSRSPSAGGSSHGDDFQQLGIICELYSQLYTNIWPSAFQKGKLTFSGESDDMIIKAIQEILEDFIQLANEECQTQGTEVERALKRQSKNEMYPEHKVAIKRIRWTTVQYAVDTVSQMWYKIRTHLQGFARQIQPFVNECSRIGCLMSLHEPRILIKDNALYGTDVNEDVYAKLSPEGNKVEFVVWPALMLTNGQVISKGVVQCYKADPRHNQRQTYSSVV